MALEMMFQDTSTEVNVSSQGGKKASRMIDNIASKPADTNVFDVAKAGMAIADGYFKMDNAIEADTARTDYLKLMMSPEYRDSDAAGRTEALEGVYSSISQGKSKAYVDSFTSYSSQQYITEYDKREAIIDNAFYQKAGPAYTAWLEQDSKIQRPAWKEGDDEDMRYMTNKEAGLKPENFTNEYHSMRDRTNKAAIGNAILSDMFGEMAFNVSQAGTPEDLQRIIEENHELSEPFEQNPYFLDNKSEQGLEAIKAERTKYNNVIIAKNKQFKSEALTRVEMNKDLNNPDIAKQYVKPLNEADYIAAYGDKAEQKYNDDLHKATTMEEARQKSFVYDPDITLDWSSESKETKELYQRGLDEKVSMYFENGNVQEAGRIIINNGSIDKGRLNNIKENLNAGLSGDNAQETMKQLMVLKEKNSAAFSALYTADEKADILATDVLSRVGGLDLRDTWLSVKGPPSGEPTTMSPYQKKQYATLREDAPFAMKEELAVLKKALAANNVSAPDILTTLEAYKKTEPYKVSFDGDVADTKTKDILKERFLEYIGDGIGEFNPNTNAYDVYDSIGIRRYSVDKAKFIKASTSFRSISKYNYDHYIATGLDETLDNITSKMGQIGLGGPRHGFRPNVHGYTTLEEQAEKAEKQRVKGLAIKAQGKRNKELEEIKTQDFTNRHKQREEAANPIDKLFLLQYLRRGQ